jgi:integrase
MILLGLMPVPSVSYQEPVTFPRLKKRRPRISPEPYQVRGENFKKRIPNSRLPDRNSKPATSDITIQECSVMAGMRNVTKIEFESLLSACDQVFTWQIAQRYKCMFQLQASTGLRASEVRTLEIRDVSTDGKKASDYVTVQKRNMKGKRSGRVIPTNSMAKRAIEAWLSIRDATKGTDLLFSTTELGANKNVEKGFTNQPVHLCTYVHAFEEAATFAGIPKPVNTHSLRKFFAVEFYKASGNDLVATSRALGHSSIETTIAYLKCADEVVNALIRTLFD